MKRALSLVHCARRSIFEVHVSAEQFALGKRQLPSITVDQRHVDELTDLFDPHVVLLGRLMTANSDSAKTCLLCSND